MLMVLRIQRWGESGGLKHNGSGAMVISFMFYRIKNINISLQKLLYQTKWFNIGNEVSMMNKLAENSQSSLEIHVLIIKSCL